MQKYINNVQDTLGNAIGSVTVTIRDVPSGSLSSIFSDNSGTTKTNPFTNDDDGEFFFYAVDGRYDVDLTGPVTESFSDVRLLDILTSGITIRINANINTATPPTTEAVIVSYEIYDLANDDKLMELGFEANNTLILRNEMRAGRVRLLGRQTGGAQSILFEGNPDGAIILYNTGLPRFVVDTVGRIGLRSDGNTDAEDRHIRFEHQDSTLRGRIGYIGDAEFHIRNQVHGGIVILEAEDSGTVLRTLFSGDPDGQTTVRGDSNVAIEVSGGSAIAANFDGGGKAGLRFNNVEKFRTVLHTAADQISGAEIVDGEGNFTPVGLGVSKETALTTTGTFTPFTQARAGKTLHLTPASAANIDTFASTGASQTNIPNGTMWFVQVNGAGVVTFRGGALVTIRFYNGAGAAPPDADVIIARGGIATIRKVNDTIYDIWGTGLS